MGKRKKKTTSTSQNGSESVLNNNKNNKNKNKNEKSISKLNQNEKIKNQKIDSTNINEHLAQQEPEQYPVPPYTFDIHLRKRELTCRVMLHKIPHHLISVEVLENRLRVDTLKYTKKYKLDVEFPRGIKVDEGNALAEHNHGTLRIVMNIKFMPQSEQKKEIEMIKEKREARKIKFQSPLSKKVQERLNEHEKNTQKNQKSSVKQQRKAREHELNQKATELKELRNRVKNKKINQKKKRKEKVLNRKRKRAHDKATNEEPAFKLQKTLGEDL